MQADRGLQVGAVEGFAEHAAELAVHADVDVGLDQSRDFGDMAAQRKDHVDLCAYALHQAADLGDIAGAVEVAVARANDVDTWFLAGLAVLRQGTCRHGLHAVLGPQPVHGAVGALPLVFVDGARQKADQVGALGRDAAADHLGDRAGDHHRRQVGVEHGVGLLHGPFGAFAAQLFFSQTGDHNRQLVRWQCVGVMQHRGDRQVLAADRAVDHHLQALDGRENIDRAPVTACAVVVNDVSHRRFVLDGDIAHEPMASWAARFLACFSRWRFMSFLKSG